MSVPDDVVITGLGIVSPLGLGKEAFWKALCEQRSGVGLISRINPGGMPVRVAGEIKDFDAKKYVRPRKSIKIMSRDMQFAVTAGSFAAEDAGIAPGSIDPDRFGVVFGADAICTPIDDCVPPYKGCYSQGQFDYSRWVRQMFETSYPLAFLRTLPNLSASHISIALDARGPNNTLHQAEVSSLMAMSEAVRVIESGRADVVMTGGSSSALDAFDWARSCSFDELSRRNGDGSGAPRPFDLGRDGQVRGEGAAALVFERRSHAEARGAEILACVLGSGAGASGRTNGVPAARRGLELAMASALGDARLSAGDVGHVNANGLATTEADRLEAAAIHALFADTPVTAAKSFFGNLGAATGAMEAAASVLALVHAETPVTLNYDDPDPHCPVNVIHDEPLRDAASVAMLINQTRIGQASAMVIGGA